jgi:hypothetical protein
MYKRLNEGQIMNILTELNKIAEELNKIEEPRVHARSKKRYEILEVQDSYVVRDIQKSIVLTRCKTEAEARRVIEILNHVRIH